jgi:hypothetical protein
MTLYEVSINLIALKKMPESMIWKIFVNEIPLSNIRQTNFIDLVVERDVRTERPEYDEAPQLSDTIWEIAV